MIPEPTKLCQKCGFDKPVSAFSKNKTTKDGLQGHCKDCYRSYYEDHQEELIQKSNSNYWDNHESHLRRGKERRTNEPEVFVKHRKTFRERHIERIILVNARDRAKRYGLPFDLVEEDIVIPNICPVLGIPITRISACRSAFSPSLDKIVPELGYVHGNIAVISDRANRLKSDGTIDEHRKISEWMGSGFPISSEKPSTDLARNLGMLIRAARKRAKKSGIPCTITARDIFTPCWCPVLGIPISPGIGRMDDYSPSIDRRRPELGYTPENSFLVSWRANRIKSDGTAEEHRKIADWIERQLVQEELVLA